MIKRLIKRWKEVKALLTAEEYFIAVANQKNPYGRKDQGPIVYEYMNNTDRDLFYLFVHDHIENNLRPITGMFLCVRTFEDRDKDVFIMKDSRIKIDNGYITAISNGSTFSYHIPTEEIYSHFKYEGKE